MDRPSTASLRTWLVALVVALGAGAVWLAERSGLAAAAGAVAGVVVVIALVRTTASNRS